MRRSPVVVVLGGVVTLAALFAAGAAVSLPRIERRIAAAVEVRLAQENIDVEVRMSGQDVTLFCIVPIPALNMAVRYAATVDGVRSVALDPSCTTGGIPVDDSTTSTTIETGGTESTTPVVDTTSTTAAAPTEVTVVLREGAIELTGSVASTDQQSLLVEAASVAVGEDQVDDRLVVDDTVSLTDTEVEGIADVTGVMSTMLVSGEIVWDGTAIDVSAVAVDDGALDRFRSTVEGAFAVAPTFDGALRPTAAEADAAATERLLNELVAAEPILFDKGSVTVSGASLGTLRRAAAIAEQFGGMVIEVQGHTDSEGDAGRNLTLSRQRAAATLDALVELGVPAGDLISKGYGEKDLILDENGRELPERSRRVVFVVSLA